MEFEGEDVPAICLSAGIWINYEEFAVSCLYCFYFGFFSYSLFAQRKAFHPYFSILFIGTVYFNWIVALGSLLASAFFFLDLIEASNVTVLVLWPMYFAAVPLSITCIFERLLATMFYQKYEKMRPWPLFLIPLLALIGFLCVFAVKGFELTELPIPLLTLPASVLSLIGIAIVIVLNVRWTLSHKNTPTPLTAKYQLAENIKTSKIVLPYIFFDTLLKIVDLSCTYLFSIDLVYVPENCQKQPVLYNTVFFAVLVFRHILVFAIPTTAVLWSSILRKRLRGLVVTLFGVRSRRIDTLLQKREFRNAIGQKVTLSASQDQYFNQLAGLW